MTAAGTRAGSGDRAAAPRHVGDALRLVLAVALVALTALPVESGDVPVLEEHAFRLVNDLPAALFPVLWVPMQLGALLAAPAVGALALAARRPRLAVVAVASGTAAWVLARLLKDAFDRGRPAVLLDDVHLRGVTAEGLGFVSGHAAVAAALVTAAVPYVPRRVRRLALGLAVVVALARIYVGAHLPLDVIGGAALGWGVGSAVHLLAGAPRGRATPAVVRATLDRMGLAAHDVRPVPGRGRTSSLFLADGPGDEPLFVKVLTDEHRDADLLHRGWRRLVDRWLGERGAFAPPRERAYHEAALAELARRGGVPAPAVRAVQGFRRSAVLVLQHVPGRALDGLDPAAVDDEDLRAAWRAVAALHGAGLAHGDLTGANVLVGDGDGAPSGGRVWVVDFATATTGADRAAVTADRADLLAATAAVVGPARAVAAATAVVGEPALAPLVGEFQGARWWRDDRLRRRVAGPLAAELQARLDPAASSRPAAGAR